MVIIESDVSLGDRRLDCKYCGKVFKSHNYVKMHEKWHKGELQHKCNECGREFRYPSELKKHLSIHTGELPYKCDQCGRSFNRAQAVNEHVRVDHNGEAPSLPRPIKRENFKHDIERNLEQELFKNISQSEISLKENSSFSDMRAMETVQPFMARMDQDADNDIFNQWQKEYGISFAIPEIKMDTGLNIKQEYFQTQARNEQKPSDDDWREDSSLPTGWKSNMEGHFMSPEGQTFGSRRAVREFLIRHGATDREIQMVNQGSAAALGANTRIGRFAKSHQPNDGCQKCLLIKDYEKKLMELRHSHN